MKRTVCTAVLHGALLFVGWIAAAATIDALVARCWWPGMTGACEEFPPILERGPGSGDRYG